MKTEEFDVQVPRDMVAQIPVNPRDHSKLLVYRRDTGEIEHKHFFDLPQYIREGDCLVFNNSRVIPARLRGNIDREPMEEVTVLLLRKQNSWWEALVESGEVFQGETIDFTGFTGYVKGYGDHIGKRKERIVYIELSDESKIEQSGEPPVPPYIHGYKGDPERYQTVYNKIRGSAAAPTAGLHFTNELLDTLRGKGVNLAFVTLHVGVDTFMPVLEDTPDKHKMYTEWCELSEETAKELNRIRANGGKVIGVGTTSVRTMESSCTKSREFLPTSKWTDIYILPGYKFNSIDAMITNFHYPKSTNIMMIASLIGLDELKRIYKEAVDKSYRFYSFGDSMFVI